jgi:hypothetical protein
VGCYTIGDAVNVNVMGTDPDDAVLRYEFQNLPPGVIHADVTSGLLTGEIGALAVPGTYEVTVIVTDGAGNSTSITFDWCIEPPANVCIPDPLVDLVGYIYQDAGTGIWTGKIRNQSELCTYDVGFASYSKFGNKLEDQTLFDANPAGDDGFDLLPGEFVLLTVDTPECAAQLDIYFDASHLGVYAEYDQTQADMPPLTLPEFFTGNYGPLGDIYGPRRISSLHIGGDNFCVPTTDNGTPEPEQTDVPTTPEPEQTQAVPARDADWDGIEDNADACPSEGDWGLGLDGTGCPYKDTDGDSVFDRNDSCPTRGDEYGNGIDASGCPIPDAPETPAATDPAPETTPEAGS